MTYIISLWLIPNIGQIDPFSPYENIHFIWTQMLLQPTGIVFPHHPLSLSMWMEISMHFHCLETIIWSLRIYVHDTPPLYTNPKVKAGHLTWSKGQGWSADMVWRSRLSMTYPLTSKCGRKWTLGKSRLITWPSSPVCPISLSLVWNLVKETARIYAGLFGNIYFQNLIQN